MRHMPSSWQEKARVRSRHSSADILAVRSIASWLRSGSISYDQPRETTKPTVFLTPQFVIERFRYDFAIVINGKPAILIECDGKDFHESPGATENDRTKDAKAKEVGAVMLRFTGSRIFRELQSCAEETIAALATC